MATPAFELKGTVSTLTVLRLRSTDLAQIGAELAKKVAQLPHFFLQAPVVVDVSALDEGDAAAVDLGALAALLREHKLVPVAASGLVEARHAEAAAAGLGLLKGALPGSRRRAVSTPGADADASASEQPTAAGSAGSSAPSSTAPAAGADAPSVADGSASPGAAAPPAAGADDAAAAAPAAAAEGVDVAPPAAEPPPMGLLIRQPVRGGQVVFSPTDLVVLGPVNAGAEVIADGNIHVYGRLSGRALAGAHGNEQARIFCANLDAELVSVAGEYRRADQLPAARRGGAAQIYLDDAGALVVAEL